MKEDYDKIKDLFLITENKSKSKYRSEISIYDIDTDSILSLDNFELTDPSLQGSDGFFVSKKISVSKTSKEIKNVEYKINAHGFRTKHFEDKTDKDIVLATGCSSTFGLSLPEKYTWPSLLEAELNKDADLFRVYNLGFPGHGYFIIIKNIFSFIKKYGKPKAIFIVFPNINRDVYFSKIRKKFIAQVVNIGHVFNGKKDMKDFVMGYDEGANTLKTIAYVNWLELFCSAAGIKLFWTAWDDADIIEKIKFNNYTPSYPTFYSDSLPENIEYKKVVEPEDIWMWDIAGDKVHPGINWNYSISRIFADLHHKSFSGIINTKEGELYGN
jgi:hypothetical protein